MKCNKCGSENAVNSCDWYIGEYRSSEKTGYYNDGASSGEIWTTTYGITESNTSHFCSSCTRKYMVFRILGLLPIIICATLLLYIYNLDIHNFIMSGRLVYLERTHQVIRVIYPISLIFVFYFTRTTAHKDLWVIILIWVLTFVNLFVDLVIMPSDDFILIANLLLILQLCLLLLLLVISAVYDKKAFLGDLAIRLRKTGSRAIKKWNSAQFEDASKSS